ncbi:hypothetical protein BD769DRAFT_1675381 [Suillus cothurnatus]|nr:hypothetical protein BD769DRAFT_1675381 [Suillus cothurnatus]
MSSMLMLHAVLDLTGKMLYFKKNWLENLQDDFEACYCELGQAASTSQPSLAKKGKASGLKKFIHETQSSEEDDDDETVVTHTDPSRPWYASFKNYIDAINGHRYGAGDIIEALQYIKCALCHDVLFRDPGPSSSTEEALKDLDTESDTNDSEKLSDAEDEGWDALLEGDEDLIESDSDFV